MGDRPTTSHVAESALPPISGLARALMALPWVFALGLLALIAQAIATVFAQTPLAIGFWVALTASAGAAIFGAVTWVWFGPGRTRIAAGAVLGGVAVVATSTWIALAGR